MSFDEPPEVNDIHAECAWEIHELQKQIVAMKTYGHELEAQLAAANDRIAAIRKKITDIVCTEGVDAGVVMLSQNGQTHIEVVDGKSVQVYDHQYFSPLGDALIELWELTSV